MSAPKILFDSNVGKSNENDIKSDLLSFPPNANSFGFLNISSESNFEKKGEDNSLTNSCSSSIDSDVIYSISSISQSNSVNTTQDTPLSTNLIPNSFGIFNSHVSPIPSFYLSFVTYSLPGFVDYFSDFVYPNSSLEKLIPLTSLPSISSNSSLEFPKWDDTLIIFDWDDTLLPSTWLTPGKFTSDGGCVFDPEEKALLMAMSEVVYQTLHMASQCGNVIIITNAESGWIELSCERFFPNLSSYIKGFDTISARSTYKGQPVFNPSLWKQQSFYNIIYNFCYQDNDRKNFKKNIISIGDSMHERSALIYSQKELNDPLILHKSIKLMERPTIYELTKEHEIIHNWFKKIIFYQDLLDLVIFYPNIDPLSDSNMTSSILPSFNLLTKPIDCPSFSASATVSTSTDLLISVENYS